MEFRGGVSKWSLRAAEREIEGILLMGLFLK
jgi:hypothetical protein